MAKKRRSRSRSTLPHANAPTQHTPAGIMQRASKVVANAATTVARQLMSSGSKAMRRNKNQGSGAMVQQGDASTTANTQGANASNYSKSGVNATQEHGAMDPNALLLSDLESRAPRFATNTTSRSSPSNSSQTTTPTSGAIPSTSQAPAPTPSATPPSSQNTTLASNTVPYGINPSTPPRLNASGVSGETDVGADLLSNQGTSMSIGELYIPAPSPRGNTQSPETHQLQQTLRNSAMATVAHSDSSSDSGNCGPFNSLLANDTSAFVETVQEGGSDDDRGWPEGAWPDDDLDPRLLNVYDPSSTYDSRLQELHIDTEDPGIADFALNVGALGNASGTPMDGAQNMSFGESAVDGGNADGGNEGVASNINLDPRDPSVIATMLTQPPGANSSSPTTIQFEEQVLVTNYSPNHSPKHTLGTTISTLTGISGGNGATGPTQGDPTSMQGNPSQGNSPSGNPTSSQPDGNGPQDSGDPNSNNSNGNGGNQVGSELNNGPQGPDPSGSGLHKLVLAYQTMGGPLQNWGIDGTIQVTEVVRFTPDTNLPVPNQLALNSVRHLVRNEIVDRVTDHVYFNNQHNDKPRVRAIINGMDVYVLTAPNTPIISDNLTMLEDDVRSSKALCDMLIGHLLYAETLPPHLLPWEVPIVLYAGRMHAHPYTITGSFGHVKKIYGTNTIVIPYGRDINGAPITDPVVIQPPVPPPIHVAPTGGAPPAASPVLGNGPDPNVALIQGVLTTIQAMTQMNLEQNARNASMTQQQ